MITKIKTYLTNGSSELTGKGAVSQDELDWCYPDKWDTLFAGGVYFVELEDGRRGRLLLKEVEHDEMDDQGKHQGDEPYQDNLTAMQEMLDEENIQSILSCHRKFGRGTVELYVELMGGPFGRHLIGSFMKASKALQKYRVKIESPDPNEQLEFIASEITKEDLDLLVWKLEATDVSGNQKICTERISWSSRIGRPNV